MSGINLLDINRYRLELSRIQSKPISFISSKIIEIITTQTKAERISFILLDQTKNIFKIVNSMGIPKNIAKNIEIDMYTSPILNEVYNNNKTLYCENILLNSKFKIQKRFRYSSFSFISSPIIFNNNVIGFISLSNFKNDIHPSFSVLIENLINEFLLILKNNKNQFLSNAPIKNISKKINSVLSNHSLDNHVNLSQYPHKNIFLDIPHIYTNNNVINLYLFSIKNELLLKNNNSLWITQYIHLIAEFIPKLSLSLIKLNHGLYNILKKNSKNFNILGLSLDLNKKKLHYINNNYYEGIFYDVSNQKLHLLKKNSKNFLSNEFKINEKIITFKNKFILILLLENFFTHFEKTNNIYELLSNTLRTHKHKKIEEIINEFYLHINADKTENKPLIAFKN